MPKKLIALAASLLALFVLITYFNYTVISSNTVDTDLNCGFTDHFHNWLGKNGYSNWGFERPDIKCGAFGGKTSDSDTLKNVPVIFIHGNSDVGFGRGTADGYVSWQTGFRSLATFLAGKGYEKSELYTTTWGPANPNAASNNYHSKEYVTRLRAFVEAVIAYTGAQKVNIIGHSMGVTLGRKVIKGGNAIDHSAGNYDVGPSLKNKVKTFIGLAGANLGLTACWTATTMPTCGTKDGFFPGAMPSSGPSTFLNDLNVNGGAEGDKVYTIWSKYDDLILYECVVWGKVTCRIPGQQGEVEKTTP